MGRFINKVFTDTTQANTQRIKYYDGAQIYTKSGGGKLWIRDSTFSIWRELGPRGWGLKGDAGTNDAVDFLGTTDSVDFSIRVNNFRSGFIGTTGNTFLGYRSGELLTPSGGSHNTFIGWKVSPTSLLGLDNTAIGYEAFLSNIDGIQNTFVGSRAGRSCTGCDFITSIGVNSQQYATTAFDNTSIGYSSLQNNITGISNTALGTDAGKYITGNSNIVIGSGVAIGLTSGSNNIIAGRNTGAGLGSGSNNIIFDAAGSFVANQINGTIIFRATAERFRVDSAGNFGIGLTTPDSMFTVLSGAWLKRGVRLSGLPTSGIYSKSIGVASDGTLFLKDTSTFSNKVNVSDTATMLAPYKKTFGILNRDDIAAENRTFNAASNFFRIDSASSLRLTRYKSSDTSISRLDLATSSTVPLKLYYQDDANSKGGVVAGAQVLLSASNATLQLFANYGTSVSSIANIASADSSFNFVTSKVFAVSIPTLGVDTTNYKPIVADPISGRIYRMANWPTGSGGGSGETNTASNLGGGLANYSTKVGVDLQFNSFLATDFDLVSNVIGIDYANGQTANGSTKGFLSAADWTTFNNKGSGTVTGSGSANRVAFWSGASALSSNSKLLYDGLTSSVQAQNSSQTADIFQARAYDDTTAFRVESTGNTVLGRNYDYANGLHTRTHTLRYVYNAYSTSGIRIYEASTGSAVRLHAISAGTDALYLTKDDGTAAGLSLGIWKNPSDGTTFSNSTNNWTINNGHFNVPAGTIMPRAGTTAASTAPLKKTSGPINTTAEAGAEEYNGTFYNTKGSGLRLAQGGVIADFYTDAGNVGTGETDLYSYTTPANTFANDGEKVTVEYGVSYVTPTVSKTVKIYFAGTEIYSGGAVTTTYILRKVTVTIVRLSSSSVRITLWDSGSVTNAKFQDITGLTLSGTNILKVTGTSAAGATNDIIARFSTVSWQGVAAN